MEASSSPQDDAICVIIPAYNEAGAIGSVLAELAGYAYQVVVVDDGSSDSTLAEAARFRVTILHHITNLGQGAALQTGIRYALQKTDAQVLVSFDADGQHDPADIRRLTERLSLGRLDAALGSRFIHGGEALAMPASKRITLWLAVGLTRLITGLPLTDTHNGLRAFTRTAASQIELRQNGMAHASEILNQIASLKLRWGEAPVTIRYTQYSRRKGQSIFNSINILWELLTGKIR
jgi:glycosyltransferase involved in cell wall biosynthesis